jgi:hypothetical protein
MLECCYANDGVTWLYACSGAANTGYLANQVARKIMNAGCGNLLPMKNRSKPLFRIPHRKKKNCSFNNISIADLWLPLCPALFPPF